MNLEYIDKIIKSNDNEKMVKMKNILEDVITYLKTSDYDKYNEIEWKLYETIEGKRLTKERAKEWVESMRPRYKWSFDDIEKMNVSKHIDIPIIDLYVLMNMMYTDYFDIVDDDIDKCIKMSLDWYNDPDTKLTGSEKLFCYYKNIVR